MTVQKISKQAEITVNLGDYQNIKLSSGVECDISFSSEEERQKIEEQKWHDIALDLRSALVNTLKDLKKTTSAPENFAQACADKVEGKVLVK